MRMAFLSAMALLAAACTQSGIHRGKVNTVPDHVNGTLGEAEERCRKPRTCMGIGHHAIGQEAGQPEPRALLGLQSVVIIAFGVERRNTGADCSYTSVEITVIKESVRDVRAKCAQETAQAQDHRRVQLHALLVRDQFHAGPLQFRSAGIVAIERIDGYRMAAPNELPAQGDDLGFRSANGGDSGAERRVKTYPSFFPQGPLDRIYFRGPFRLLAARTCRLGLCRVASDHLPLDRKSVV